MAAVRASAVGEQRDTPRLPRLRVRLVQQASGGGADGRSTSWHLQDLFGEALNKGLFVSEKAAREYVEGQMRAVVTEVRPLSPRGPGR